MFILKTTQLRCNPYAPYTSPEGVRYPRMPAELYEEIPEPAAPIDFSDDTYYKTEQQDAPYVVYTRKSDEQIAQVRSAKLQQFRDDLTDNGGCLVQGKWFHTDTKSKQQQMALTMMGASLPTGLQWKTMDGTFIEMTQALATELFAAQVSREATIFFVCESKKSDTTPLNEGWPARYVKA